jgi:hypothetical protein
MAVSKPTVDDLVGWLKLQSEPDAVTMDVYSECMDAAILAVEDRIDNAFVVALGWGDLTDDANYPQKVRTAELMLGARLAKRSSSPEGVAGMSDLGIAVRILNSDPDIEMLIRRVLKVDGFA